MRNVITISLPDDLVKFVEQEGKRGKFASRSAYFRHMVWEQQLLKRVRQSQKEFAEGKGKLLTSFHDLR